MNSKFLFAIIAALLATNIVTGFVVQKRTQNSTKTVSNNLYTEIAGGAEIPGSWHVAYDESPTIVKSIEDLAIDNAEYLILANKYDSQELLCFSGGCDLPTLTIHVVEAGSVRDFIASHKNKAVLSDQTVFASGTTWRTTKVRNGAVDTLANNNSEKYGAMETYFTFGQLPATELTGTVEVAYIFTFASGASSAEERHTLATLDLQKLPKALINTD